MTSHRDKEILLRQAFKDRLGTSEFAEFSIQPETFIDRVDDFLGALESDFTEAEIDGTVKSLPNDKSLGPDGFSNEFLKRCWPIIKYDFYNLCKDL